jgi:hypothetical protein
MSKVKHEFLEKRNITNACIVLRLDRYKLVPAERGQFYNNDSAAIEFGNRGNMHFVAVWPTHEQAVAAAKWAAKTLKGQYGVFMLTNIVEEMVPVTNTTVV